MKYTIWRISADGTSIQIQTAGETSVIDRAFEKARTYNERLRVGEPDSEDRFIVIDNTGKEVLETDQTSVTEKPSSVKKNKSAKKAAELKSET
jgi:hypothetical protein